VKLFDRSRLPWARTTSRWFLGPNHIGSYMSRWYLQTPWFTVRLHHILRSDEARALHDHPWDFWSLLLTGGYTEITPTGTRRWPWCSLVRRRAEDLHRLVLDRPVWTLVWTGPRRRSWGFLVDGQWIYWRNVQAQWAGGAP
jgi:hypothetical protein